ncbi:MAG: oxidoreductase [Bacteroidota bacterium]
MPRTALLLGATGLVGRDLLDVLLASDAYEAVTTLGRREMEQTHDKLTHHVIDFDQPPKDTATYAADDVFCCLGTTIKQAGSQEAFRKVDFTYPVRIGQRARAAGAKHYLLVSAIGADPSSSVFYNRVKGEVERAVQQLGYARVSLFRPSLLTGDRDEYRRGERIGAVLFKVATPLLVGPLRSLRPTPADAVAEAMHYVALQDGKGPAIYEPEAIKDAAALAS